MILNFPPSASQGDRYTSDNAIYIYNGTYWQIDGTTLGRYVENLPTTGSNTFIGNQTINGSIAINAMINPQNITEYILIPTGFNALILGEVGFQNEVVVETGALLTIL